MDKIIYGPCMVESCPHCGTTVRFNFAPISVRPHGNDYPTCELVHIGRARLGVQFKYSECPNCSKAIICGIAEDKIWMVYPRVFVRRPIHPSVPVELKSDYEEAILVLTDSPKASAALSRRCLQALLNMQGFKKANLYDQLSDVQDSLPQYVQSFVDNVRKLGNISAHPKRSRATGEIVDVDAGEAEWIIELIEELFDHYYAKPAEAKLRHDKLAAKFADVGNL